MAVDRAPRLVSLTIQVEPHALKRLNGIARARKCSTAAVARDGLDRVLPILESEVVDRVLTPEAMAV